MKNLLSAICLTLIFGCCTNPSVNQIYIGMNFNECEAILAKTKCENISHCVGIISVSLDKNIDLRASWWKLPDKTCIHIIAHKKKSESDYKLHRIEMGKKVLVISASSIGLSKRKPPD